MWATAAGSSTRSGIDTIPFDSCADPGTGYDFAG